MKITKSLGFLWVSDPPRVAGSGRLAQAVEAARSAQAGNSALSGAARGRIAEALFESPAAAPRILSAPFLPFRRLALASALPVAAGVLLFSFGMPGSAPVVSGAAQVAALKDGDQVRFTLDGSVAQRVYRSTDPQGSDNGRQMAVRGGSFRDRLDDQASIVFYRVE